MKKYHTPIPISSKVNRILNGMLAILFLFMVRVWFLAIYHHDENEKASEKPQKRTEIIKADRATIRDRFGIPLAMNKVQYNASICYGEIRDIPRISYKVDEKGKKVKSFQRKEYITKLSRFLASSLKLDAERIEDLIHARASIIGKIPFVIKENISEEAFFKLKMVEKDWPGLHIDFAAKRFYPQAQVGGEVVGYMGPISRNEYEAITTEMRDLNHFLTRWEQEGGIDLPYGYSNVDEVKMRLKEIEEKAYTISDYVGKSGIEKSFDEALRGCSGKKCYHADIKGNYLRELSGTFESREGNRVYLTISKELQEYAESLLAECEQSPLKKDNLIPEKGIWMKGGAIVALDPNSGEVLALASYPRFDPNDFIRSKDDNENLVKNLHVQRWLELESYIGSLWDGKEAMVRERFDLNKGMFYEEKIDITWENYLKIILLENSPVKKTIEKMTTLSDHIFFQRKVEELLSYFKSPDITLSPSKIFDAVFREENTPISGITLQQKDFLEKKLVEKNSEIEMAKKALYPYFHALTLNYDKLLLVDLSHLSLDHSLFTAKLLDNMGNETLSSYRALSSKISPIKDEMKKIIKEVFHKTDFKHWREQFFKEYLAEKRKIEELEKKKYAKPYIEYLDEAENILFYHFFEKNKNDFLTFFLNADSSFVKKETAPYLSKLYQLREEVLKGEHQQYRWAHNFKEIVPTFEKVDPSILSAYLKTLRSFEELDNELYGKYSVLRNNREKDLAASFYPKYGYGFLRSYAFRQSGTIGSIFKLVPAYEALRQRYLKHQKLGKNTSDLNPLNIIDDKHKASSKEWNVGFTVDKKPIPLIYKGGRLPRSEHAGIGHVDLVKALETSSNPYFSILSGDILDDPEDLCRAAFLFSYGQKTGIELPLESPGSIPQDVIYNRSGLYAMSIGQHSLTGTPLQTAVMLGAIANYGTVIKPKILHGEIKDGEFVKEPTTIIRKIFMPPAVRNVLLKGLKQVVHGENGTARSLKKEFPMHLLKSVIGKTSTCEVIERLSLDGKGGVIKCKNIWFGALYFDPNEKEYKKPELVVVVYLRYGEWGRNVAPYAVKIIQKYLEIKERG